MALRELRVCVDVADLEAAVAFYTSVFGLRVGRRMSPAWVELVGAPCPLDLLLVPEGSAPVPGGDARRSFGRHWTPVHLDFVVDDLDAVLAKALAAGAKLDREVQDRPYGRMANLADPFGNGLCVLEMKGRGYDEPGAF